jgi:asparagine synthase (glutamine-hydrolysing)
VTDVLGVPLTEVRRTPGTIDPLDLRELAGEPWTAMSGVDAARDRDEVCRVQATGARAILSGQGGDAAFFQMPSAMVAADAFRAEGLRLLSSPLLAAVARRTRRSVWAVLAQVRKGREETDYVSSLVSPALRASRRDLVHAWTLEARSQDLAPGKILHVEATANLHVNHGRSRRRQAADLIFPLMTQPVLEHCLSIPTPWLAGESYDRPFAREAFADRIPDLVRHRRAKGMTTVYFAKLVANSLEVLRPFLLDGTLCAAGLLDRRRLEDALRPEGLIWDAKAGDIMSAATVEAWVQHWQRLAPDSPAASRPRP